MYTGKNKMTKGIVQAIPGANPTIASYNASVAKTYSAVNSMARL
jgi:hypothetical protein